MFADKHFIVTGAASGIGLATAKALIAEGARVTFWDKDPQVAERAGACDYAIVDVTQADTIHRALHACLERVGRLDGVVHCAGIARVGNFEQLDIEQYRQVVLVNLFGSIAVAHAALPYIQKTHGSFIFVSSVSAFYGPPDFVVYGATKAAVLNLAQGLRVEYGASGAHIGVICPHFVDTPMYQQESRKSVLSKSRSPFIELRGAETIAEAIIRGIRRRQFMIWTGWRPRLIFWLTRLTFFAAHRIMASTWRQSLSGNDVPTIAHL